MMLKARIQEYTPLEACASWLKASDEGLLLSVSSKSSFAPMTEGVALGILHEVARRAPIHVETSTPYDAQNLERLPVFESPFGVALALAAKSVKTPETDNAQGKLANTIWDHVRGLRGLLGKGNRAGLVFRDPDYWMPACLRSGSSSFPLRDQFRSAILGALRSQGFRRAQYSRSEEDVITFLYEAARNSHEHARVDTSKTAVRGIRGILVERLTLSNPDELHSRSDLHPLLREYVQGIWHVISPNARLLYMMTVADIGPGIHNTLPPLQRESEWDRLNRAFEPGQTRKNKTGDIEAGLGLSKLRASAERLRAFLFVRSAELLAFCDFSSSVKTPNPTNLSPWPESIDIRAPGTSLTLVWPELQGGGDQGTLF